MRPAGRGLTLALVALIGGGCVASTPPSAARPASTATPSFAASPFATPEGSLAGPRSATPTPTPTPAPTPAPAAAASPTPGATIPTSCAARTLASMSEAQRIGQLFMIGLSKDRLDADERAAITLYHFGSVSFTTQTAAGVAAVRAVADAVQAQVTRAATHGVRFFVAANQEGGLIQALSGPGFDAIPSALSQGTLSTTVLKVRAARWGRELKAAGVNFDLAPVADVVPPGTDVQNAPIGMLKREYGHDPTTVANHVAAFIAGMRQAGVATSAKHFPGLGRVIGNTDVTSAVTDTVTTRSDPYLEPFTRAIDAGVPFVMVSLATYERIDPAHLAVFSPTLIDGVLRGDLGFRGVVISDSLGATAVKSIPPATRAIDFLDAGGDMIIANELSVAVPMAQGLAARAAASASFRARVNNATLRVLRAKSATGLLSCGG